MIHRQFGTSKPSPPKLWLHSSPIIKIYGSKGLSKEYLLTSNINSSHHNKAILLTVYRNLIRLAPHLNEAKYFKDIFKKYLKFRFYEDYNIRRSKLLSLPATNTDDNNKNLLMRLSNDEFYERLINSVNFVNNACCQQITDCNDRSIESKILNSILQFENSKITRMKLSWGLIPNINTFMLRRQMKQLKQLESTTEDNAGGVGLVDESWYRYIDQLCKPPYKKDKVKLTSFSTILTFEKNLVLLNDRSKLLL